MSNVPTHQPDDPNKWADATKGWPEEIGKNRDNLAQWAEKMDEMISAIIPVIQDPLAVASCVSVIRAHLAAMPAQDPNAGLLVALENVKAYSGRDCEAPNWMQEGTYHCGDCPTCIATKAIAQADKEAEG